MKKLFVFFAALLFAANAWAAGTVTQGATVIVDANSKTITVTATADASAATYPSTALNLGDVLGWYLVNIKTSPGAVAPTDASDFTLVDANGLDVIGGAGTDAVDATSDLRFFPKNTSGSYDYWLVTDSALTLAISNNAVNSAVTIITFVFAKR